MPDPVSAAVAAGKALATSKDRDSLLHRVLGPPADALGQSLARWVDFRTANVGRVLDAAGRKLGDDLDADGQVSPRIAAHVLEAGSYCDEEVMVEYLGGVLASARSGVTRDDRGTRWAQIVTSLSAYEVRLHYVLYAAARSSYLRRELRTTWGNENAYGDLRLAIGWRRIEQAMDFVDGENGPDLTAESMFGLSRAGLVTDWIVADAKSFQDMFNKVCPEGGAVAYRPTTIGVQLFMWAHGHGDSWKRFDDPELDIPAIHAVETPDAQALSEMSLPPVDEGGNGDTL